ITQPGHQPSKDWLPIVKTPRARNKIRHVINASERAKAIDLGEKYLEREARRVGVQLGRLDKADFERVAADYGVSKMEDLYAALGYGKYSPRQVLEKTDAGTSSRTGAGESASVRACRAEGPCHQSQRHGRP